MAYICIPYDDGSSVVSGDIRFTRKEYEKLKFLANASNMSKGTVIGWMIDQFYNVVKLEEKEKKG